jgi:AcrR family transcriptional regulator
VSGLAVVDRRTVRRQETVDEIVSAAWELSRNARLGGFSMRELGARVGMRAQSLYSYFASKHELYDAMFAAGNRAFVATMSAPLQAEDQVSAIRALAHRFVRFCVDDPVRYQLLFQRPVPDFVPSAASFTIAQQAYEVGMAHLRAAGLDAGDLDLVTAVMSGLVAQQIANDPGGDRWTRLVDRAVSILLRELAPHLVPASDDLTRSSR